MDNPSSNADPLATRDLSADAPSHSTNNNETLNLTQSRTPQSTRRGEPSGSGHLQVRCPNCHAPTNVATDSALTELVCSSCGSNFSLVDSNDASREAPPLAHMGRFELIARVGMGAFGSVWKARDKQLDRTVAIKIPRQSAMTAEEQEKFFREARTAAQLRHPNIVSVHEVGRDAGSLYIVSDFVHGVTLGDWLTGQQLTSREAAELCAKIAAALHHAHEQGVIHRDLKPANIMIDAAGEPHLMDFGLARREVGEITVTTDGQVLGTPAYMSPEQAQGESHTADRRSDVYSLGVILFQLLTGELPFRGNARMVLHQVINDEPPSPRKFNANVAKDLETITLKCLEKSPSRRYTSADDMAKDLTRHIRHEPIRARRTGWFTRLRKWCRRYPTVAASLVIGSVLLTIALWALNEQLRQRMIAEKRLVTNRHQTYNLALTTAVSRIESAPKEALRLLNDPEMCPLYLRDFSWRLLDRRASGNKVTTTLLPEPTTTSEVLDVSIGRLEVSTSVPRTLKHKNPGTGEASGLAKEGIWYAPPIVTVDAAGNARRWNAINGAMLGVVKSPFGRITQAIHLTDEKHLATLDDANCVLIWDIDTGKLMAQRYKKGADRIVLSPDSLQLAVGSGISWNVLNLVDGTWVDNHWTEALRDAKPPFDGVVFSPRADKIAGYRFNQFEDTRVTLWDWSDAGKEQNAEIKVSLHPSSFSHHNVAINAQGDAIDFSNRIWRAAANPPEELLGPHNSGSFSQTLFDPIGQSLLTVSSAGELKKWDVLTLAEFPSPLEAAGINDASDVKTVAVSWDGSVFAAGHRDGRTTVIYSGRVVANDLDLTFGDLIGSDSVREPVLEHLVFERCSRNMQYFAKIESIESEDSDVDEQLVLHIFSKTSRKLSSCHLPIFNSECRYGDFRSLSEDGSRICFADDLSNRLTVIDAKGRVINQFAIDPHRGWALSEDFEILCRILGDGTRATFTDVESDSELASIQTNDLPGDLRKHPFTDPVFSPSGKLIALGKFILDMNSLLSGSKSDVIATTLADTPHDRGVFSRDERLIALGLQIVDVKSGKTIHAIPGWSGSILGFSMDGRFVAAAATGVLDISMAPVPTLRPPAKHVVPQEKVDLAAGEKLCRYQAKTRTICGLSENGHWFATLSAEVSEHGMSRNPFPCIVNIWDTKGDIQRSLKTNLENENQELYSGGSSIPEMISSPFRSMAVSDNGEVICASTYNSLWAIDGRNGALIRALKTGSDGELVFTDDPNVLLIKNVTAVNESLSYIARRRWNLLTNELSDWETEEIDHPPIDSGQKTKAPSQNDLRRNGKEIALPAVHVSVHFEFARWDEAKDVPETLVARRDSDDLEVCRLVFHESGEWLAIAPDGKYDSSNDGNVKWAWWDDAATNTQIPLAGVREQFYTPGLFHDIIHGKTIPTAQKSLRSAILDAAGNAALYEPTKD